MNPTEDFLQELHKLLKVYEEKTGVFIRNITIDRLNMARIEGKLRSERPITSISLELV